MSGLSEIALLKQQIASSYLFVFVSSSLDPFSLGNPSLHKALPKLKWPRKSSGESSMNNLKTLAAFSVVLQKQVS
jgi:hypothetical protein